MCLKLLSVVFFVISIMLVNCSPSITGNMPSEDTKIEDDDKIETSMILNVVAFRSSSEEIFYNGIAYEPVKEYTGLFYIDSDHLYVKDYGNGEIFVIYSNMKKDIDYATYFEVFKFEMPKRYNNGNLRRIYVNLGEPYIKRYGGTRLDANLDIIISDNIYTMEKCGNNSYMIDVSSMESVCCCSIIIKNESSGDGILAKKINDVCNVKISFGL